MERKGRKEAVKEMKAGEIKRGVFRITSISTSTSHVSAARVHLIKAPARHFHNSCDGAEGGGGDVEIERRGR